MSRRILFDFTNASSMTGWESVDDVVMGGRSASTLLWYENEGLRFSGHVSLEDGGGFASIRSPVRDYQLDGTSGVGLRIKGDGKSYKLTIRTDTAYDGISYQVSFPTVQDVWEELHFSYDQFIPTYHGTVLSDRPKLEPSLIKRFGFIISEKQEGDFQLQVASIWAGS